MKKFKYLFVLLIALLVLPVAVLADGEDEAVASDQSNEVRVYLFRGEGCPHCQEAEEWFDSIEEEHGNLFEVIDYETWYDTKNADLMQKVAKARGETADGVPYIIVGNKSWAGFTEDYESEILGQIQEEYAKPVSDRYDIMKLLPEDGASTEKKSTGSDVLALVAILVIVCGICFGVYKARVVVQ